jgi:predicted transcriptional regulator
VSTLTIRLPDDAAERLKSLARARGLSVNKLVERMTYEAIASFDTETRFRALAAGADVASALAILDRLDGKDAR